MHDTTLHAPATTYGDIVCAKVLRKELVVVQKELLNTLYVLGPCTSCHHLLLQRDSSAASTRGTHARTHTRSHAHAHACTHACTHTCTHARTHARTHTKVHTHLIKILHSILLLQPSAPPNAWRWRWRMLLLLLLLLLLSLKQLT